MFVTAKPFKRRAAGRARDPYSMELAARPSREINVNFPRRQPAGFPAFPPPSLLSALGDLAADGGTGIDFIDQNLTAIRKQVEEASLAAKITAVCSIAGGLASLLLIIRTGK
jgi:hypothetical protein